MREHTHFDSIESVREVRAFVRFLSAPFATSNADCRFLFLSHSILQSRPKLFTAIEIAQIGSLVPKTADEAMALIPSLREKEEFNVNPNLLQEILDEVLSVCIQFMLLLAQLQSLHQ